MQAAGDAAGVTARTGYRWLARHRAVVPAGRQIAAQGGAGSPVPPPLSGSERFSAFAP